MPAMTIPGPMPTTQKHKKRTISKSSDAKKRRSLNAILGENRTLKAWLRPGKEHFKRFSRDPQLAELEMQARAARSGLWGDPAPVAPWEFRKARSGIRPGLQTASASR